MWLRFLATLACLLITASDKNECPTGWFGKGCMFQCHCSFSGTCQHDGTCPNNESCQFGFFGPGCQYVDACSGECTEEVPTYVRDGDDKTCNPNPIETSIQLFFLLEIIVHWVRIVVSSPDNMHNISLEMNFQDPCFNERRFPVSHVSYDVYCDNQEPVAYLQLDGDAVARLCTVNVNAGRNVALKQHAWQSTQENLPGRNNSASNAVDGFIEPINPNIDTCTRTSSESKPSWGINYDRPQLLTLVNIVNPQDLSSSVQQFYMRTENDKVRVNFYKQQSTVLNQQHYLVLTGTDVSTTLTIVANADQRIVICEVFTYGETMCPDQTYGISCSELCHCKFNQSCSLATGSCSAPCRAGKYGFKCSQNCSTGCDLGICQERSGHCYNCSPGYRGALCDEACPAGLYGANCVFNCSKYCTETCDSKTGACNCTQGHLGSVCKDCPAGKFGAYCANPCPKICVGGVCDAETGTCTECPENTYGPLCTLTCPPTCKTQRCDVTNGNCPVCVKGYFGPSCTLPCSKLCKDNECNKSSGECLACRHGEIPACEACPKGTYGNNCSTPCPERCKDNVCDINLGQCFACQGNEMLPFCDAIFPSVDASKYGLENKSFWLFMLVLPLIALTICVCFCTNKQTNTRHHDETVYHQGHCRDIAVFSSVDASNYNLESNFIWLLMFVLPLIALAICICFCTNKQMDTRHHGENT